MATKIRSSAVLVPLVVLLAATVVVSDTPVPSNRAQVSTWFNQNVKPLAERKSTLDPALVTAENGKRVIKVMKDGSGDFKTITDAIKSIPIGNTKRVIVYIGPGIYNEKLKIERTKPFVTFYGSPGNMPNLTYSGTALQYGTVDSATVIVESQYFVAANIIFSNSSPRPDGKRKGTQALALRISGDKAAFYGCTLIGFQDTLNDDKGRHFFKDCIIQGTVDFIFGSGKSLYLNSKVHVLADKGLTMIVAHARTSHSEDTGFVFVHCDVTGTNDNTYLGRAWKTHPKAVYAYSTISTINPAGWYDNLHPERAKTVEFSEYMNNGPGAETSKREKYTKIPSASAAQPFLSLAYIEGSKWLLPAPKV